MTQQYIATSSQPEPLSQVNVHPLEDLQGKSDATWNPAPYFTVTRSVTFKPMTGPERRAEDLSPDVIRLIAAINRSAVPSCLLSGGSAIAEGGIPGPVLTPTPTRVAVPSDTKTLTITHKTKSGRHYIWHQSCGGWVQSDDGINPKLEVPRVDEGDNDTSHGGCKDGN